jgi:hypothetical protein
MRLGAWARERVRVTDDTVNVEDRKRRELEILNRILSDLHELGDEARQRVLQTVVTYYQFAPIAHPGSQDAPSGVAAAPGPFSEDRSISPKEFLWQKKPQTAVERVACLGYYLTHYRDMPHFKTLDISKLNTEAAQPKFSNAALAVNDAAKTGYLVPGVKGAKQLSAPGEQFVLRLPDREAARAAMTTARPRRKARKANEAAEFLLHLDEGEHR